MGRCLMCGGVGYVRVVTTRLEPDFKKGDSAPKAEYSGVYTGPVRSLRTGFADSKSDSPEDSMDDEELDIFFD